MSIKDTLRDFTLNLDPCFIPEIVPCALAEQKCILLLLALCSVCVACGILRFLSICLVILYVHFSAAGWLIMNFSLSSCVYLLHVMLGAQVLSVL